MSRAKLVKKTQADFDAEAIRAYEQQTERPFPMEELADHLLAEGWEVRIPSKRMVLARRLKQCAREMREQDAQKRKVRSMIAAKIPKINDKGEPTSEVVWDHIHGMSWDHAITAFKQRLDNHQRQDRALDRDIGSFNDNNPNAREHKIQKEMLFTYDEPAEQIVEKIEMSNKAQKKRGGKPR